MYLLTAECENDRSTTFILLSLNAPGNKFSYCDSCNHEKAMIYAKLFLSESEKT